MRACDNSARSYYHPDVKTQKGARCRLPMDRGHAFAPIQIHVHTLLLGGTYPARRQASRAGRMAVVDSCLADLAGRHCCACRWARVGNRTFPSPAIVSRLLRYVRWPRLRAGAFLVQNPLA